MTPKQEKGRGRAIIALIGVFVAVFVYAIFAVWAHTTSNPVYQASLPYLAWTLGVVALLVFLYASRQLRLLTENFT